MEHLSLFRRFEQALDETVPAETDGIRSAIWQQARDIFERSNGQVLERGFLRRALETGFENEPNPAVRDALRRHARETAVTLAETLAFAAPSQVEFFQSRDFGNDEIWVTPEDERLIDTIEARFGVKIKAEAIRLMHFIRAKEMEHPHGDAVYFGSARTNPGEPDYDLTEELGAEVAETFNVRTWTGAGPGNMRAPLCGARSVNKPVGGVKIHIEQGALALAEQNICPELGPGDVLEVHKMLTRKFGLIRAGTKTHPDHRKAVIITPGGYGTGDEMFETIVLRQLGKIDEQHAPEILLMNYGHHYTDLLRWMKHVCDKGMAKQHELDLVKVFDNNRSALEYLADRWKAPAETCSFRNRVQEGGLTYNI